MNIRTLAKEQGVDLARLIHILTWARPDKSRAEEEFVGWLDDQLPDQAYFDKFGNIICKVGTSATLWSCHTDTVHKDGGRQALQWEGDTLKLANGKPGQCLGADDGAGIWLMLEMIAAQKPGLYVFHRAEEVGGLGSDYIAKNTPELLDGIKRAIAFDRKDVDSVITYQSCGRCCSDAFAEELAGRLNETAGFEYTDDPTGTFTDTANYVDLVPECTNLSVGYDKQHGPLETQDVAHLYNLRAAVLGLDFEALPTERDPSEIDTSWGSFYSNDNYSTSETPMEKVLRERRFTLALYLQSKGYTPDQLDRELSEFSKEYWSKQSFPEPEPEPHLVLYCQDCVDYYLPEDARNGFWSDGDPCPNCRFFDTRAVELEDVA